MSGEGERSRCDGIPQELLLLLDLASIVDNLLGGKDLDRLPLRAGLLRALIVQRAEEVTGKDLGWLMEAV